MPVTVWHCCPNCQRWGLKLSLADDGDALQRASCAVVSENQAALLSFMSLSELLNMRLFWTSHFLSAADITFILCVSLQEGNREC